MAGGTKQLQVAILVAASLFQRDNVIHLMIHADQPTSCACVLVPAHDSLSRVHPWCAAYALRCPSLSLKHRQAVDGDCRQPRGKFI